MKVAPLSYLTPPYKYCGPCKQLTGSGRCANEFPRKQLKCSKKIDHAERSNETHKRFNLFCILRDRSFHAVEKNLNTRELKVEM